MSGNNGRGGRRPAAQRVPAAAGRGNRGAGVQHQPQELEM